MSVIPFSVHLYCRNFYKLRRSGRCGPAAGYDPGMAEIAKVFDKVTKYVATHRPDTLAWKNSQWLGADPVSVGSEFVYRLRDEIPKSAHADLVARDLSRTLSDFALDIRTSGPFVVLLTAPGHAGAVARAIDLAGPEEIVGTIAGDDTIFVATPDTRTAATVARRWIGIDDQLRGESS